eukprot:3882601-Amphidinium_carterae.1
MHHSSIHSTQFCHNVIDTSFSGHLHISRFVCKSWPTLVSIQESTVSAGVLELCCGSRLEGAPFM